MGSLHYHPPVLFLKRLRRSAAAEVRAKLGDAIVAIDEQANCFGVESAGVTQIRGNGCLAATADEVLFVRWLPRKEIRIPRDRIIGVERTSSQLGKTVGQPLLRVRFTDGQGRPDSVAWWVGDLSAWERTLGG